MSGCRRRAQGGVVVTKVVVEEGTLVVAEVMGLAVAEEHLEAVGGGAP